MLPSWGSDEETGGTAAVRSACGRTGMRIGRYEVADRIGSGASGDVYSARDVELEGSVALKFLRCGNPHSAWTVEGFLREARAASALNHPGIITVHEVIQSESGLGIVMELVEGKALRAFTRSPNSVDFVLRCGIQVASALAAAHSSNIIHRDIKPENIMIRADGLAKVLDFGLAQSRGSLQGQVLSELRAGTLRYMSPEQAAGESLTPATDSWVACRPGFFLPVKVLSRRFRTVFLTALGQAFRDGELNFFSELKPLAERRKFAELLASARRTEWILYAKRPFGGPQQVLDYLGRYTHRVAISNDRLLSMEDGTVCFRWKDYRPSSRQKVMAIAAEEFIRRFLLHVLPRGFVRIRRYGLLGNRHCAAKLALCRRLLGADEAKPQPDERIEDYRIRYEALTGASLIACPICRSGRMIRIETLCPTLGSGISRIDSS